MTFIQYAIVHSNTLQKSPIMKFCPQCIIENGTHLHNGEMPPPMQLIQSPTVMFATSYKAKCINGHIIDIAPPPSNDQRQYTHKDNTQHCNSGKTSCIKYDVNVLLALHMFTSGHGPTDFERLASFLGQENATCITKNISKITNDYLYNVVKEVADECAFEALLEESHFAFQQQYPNEPDTLWQEYKSSLQSQLHPNDILKNKPIGISSSIDMGWQKRGSGNAYSSPSGHMFSIGCHTKKILMFHACYKKCRLCCNAKKKKKR